MYFGETELLLQESGAPDWMTYVSFATATLVALWTLGVGIWRATRSASLSVELAGILFFRWSAAGETVFVNCVQFAEGGPCFISGLKLTLRRFAEGGMRQDESLDLISMGEPKDRGVPLHDHYFFSSSEKDLVPEDKPVRRVYYAAISESRAAIERAWSEYNDKIWSLKARAPSNFDSDEDRDQWNSISNEAIESAEGFASHCRDAIRLGIGEYELVAEIEYRSKGQNASKTRTTTASRRFRVGIEPRAVLPTQLGEYAKQFALSVLNPDPNASVAPAKPPEYSPVQVQVEEIES